MTLPRHKPIREKYNPRMNAAEKRHKARVLEEPCFGCGKNAEHAHHTLLDWSRKRFRRDHRCLLPVCLACHRLIHDVFGREETWLHHYCKTEDEAIAYMEGLWSER